MRGVEELDVFGRAHELTLQLYKATSKFHKEELYALTSQIKRAASSICANLMEGSHRLGTKEFRQFVGIANGSAGELKYHNIAGQRFGIYNQKPLFSFKGKD
jgi:four helix bundle protein